MLNFRSIVGLILVLASTLLVSCSGPRAEAPPPTYTPEQVAQVQRYAQPVKAARERMEELEDLIEERRWVDVDSLIHGPLGQLRREVSYLTRNLLPQDQTKAQELARKLFVDLERIDAAAADESYAGAIANYERAVADFDAYLELVPTESEAA